MTKNTIHYESHQNYPQLLKAHRLINQGRRGEAEQILEELQGRTEHPAAAGRAKARLNGLQSNRGGN